MATIAHYTEALRALNEAATRLRDLRDGYPLSVTVDARFPRLPLCESSVLIEAAAHRLNSAGTVRDVLDHLDTIILEVRELVACMTNPDGRSFPQVV